MFNRNLRRISTFALFVSIAVHGSLYGILSPGKPRSFERPPISIEVVHAEIKKEELPKPVEKPAVKRLSFSPSKTVPLLPPVPKPECLKDEKPAPLPAVNPLQVAEDTGTKEPDPILVPFAQKMPSIPSAPPAAIDQPIKGETGTGPREGRVAALGPVSKILGEETGPSFKKKVMPIYPEYARTIRKEGLVLLEVLISRDGVPREITLLKRAGFGFDDAAKEAILDSRFYPATEKGMPILCLVRIPIRFELSE